MAESADRSQPPISKTAIFVAAGRAVGAREPDASARNPDSLAEKLLGDATALLDHPAVHALDLAYEHAIRDVEIANLVRMMTVRTCFIDDALGRAIAGGASQVVVLGAGLDTHAYRCRDLLVGATVFEVDRPTTQAWKKERVSAVIGPPPSNLAYVAIDFEHEDLPDVLPRHGYDLSQRTFFIMEGVTMYLAEEALRNTLRFVAAHPAGSGIVFDFVYRPLVDMVARMDPANVPPAARPFLQRFQDLISNEPWRFGFPVDGERAYLEELGFELREALMIGGEESAKRYLTKADGTEVGGQAIAEAMARAAQQSRAAGRPPLGDENELRERMRALRHVMAYHIAEATVI